MGLALSAVVIAVLGVTGVPLPVDLSDVAASYSIPERLYPELSWPSIAMGSAVLFLGTQLAAFVPALRILRMRPVAARRAVE